MERNPIVPDPPKPYKTPTAEVQNTAAIGERKNMNLPGAVVTLPTLTEKVR